jgi:hypothetical protein
MNKVDYFEGTQEFSDIAEEKILKKLNGYKLWVKGQYAAITKGEDKPDFSRLITGKVIYDWNTLTGDNIEEL